ncbi:DUF5681 domain-containing protein [Thermodesulfobacteriota bacterium]
MTKKKKSSAKTEKNTANKRWKKGQSGNPKGRPVGSRNKASIAVENIFLDEQERLSRKCIKLALRGNMQALKLCIERICPVRRDTPISIKLPRITKIDDATKLTTTLIDKVTSGELTPSQGELLSRMIEKHVKVLQLNDLEMRLQQLEERLETP